VRLSVIGLGLNRFEASGCRIRSPSVRHYVSWVIFLRVHSSRAQRCFDYFSDFLRVGQVLLAAFRGIRVLNKSVTVHSHWLYDSSL